MKKLKIQRYSYHLPELEYLTRMAENPAKVAEIIVAVKISEETSTRSG